MNVMQNLTTIPAPRQQSTITPEITEALKTLRSADWRLEAEYFHLDLESRFELAEELRSTLDDLDDRQADVIARVAEDLDSEDFSEWETRCDAASRVRTVIHSIEREVTADAF
jgi:hypothetical protein